MKTAQAKSPKTPIILEETQKDLSIQKARMRLTLPKDLKSVMGTVQLTEEEIAVDERLKHILSR